MFDEELPAKKKPQVRNLEPLSLDELRGYIAEMREEIERVEAEIKRKDAHKNAADSFFKK